MTLKTHELKTLEQIRAFLEGAQPLGFEVASRAAACEFIARSLRHFEQLDALARSMSDNEAARRLNQARAELFRSINKTRQPAA